MLRKYSNLAQRFQNTFSRKKKYRKETRKIAERSLVAHTVQSFKLFDFACPFTIRQFEQASPRGMKRSEEEVQISGRKTRKRQDREDKKTS